MAPDTPFGLRTQRAANLALTELERATKKFGPMFSPHEGYAIMLEEFDELWQEIKHGTPEAMRKEAIQVAAMALRFLVDCCEED